MSALSWLSSIACKVQRPHTKVLPIRQLTIFLEMPWSAIFGLLKRTSDERLNQTETLPDIHNQSTGFSEAHPPVFHRLINRVVPQFSTRYPQTYTSVMAGLVPAIHVFPAALHKDVDARNKSGHGSLWLCMEIHCSAKAG